MRHTGSLAWSRGATLCFVPSWNVSSATTAPPTWTNSYITNKGRSPFQAVFGRVPQLPGGLFTDGGSLASSPLDPGLDAEAIRSEALQHLSGMGVDKGLRRALLRKTRNTHVPQLEPGQRCSFWRWTPEKGCVVNCQVLGLGPGGLRQAGMASEWKQHHYGCYRAAARGHWLRKLVTQRGGRQSTQGRNGQLEGLTLARRTWRRSRDDLLGGRRGPSRVRAFNTGDTFNGAS